VLHRRLARPVMMFLMFLLFLRFLMFRPRPLRHPDPRLLMLQHQMIQIGAISKKECGFSEDMLRPVWHGTLEHE
jgi:hypothetical protein